MRIIAEYCPDLALRKHKSPERHKDECLPKELKKGGRYKFLKKGQKHYWLIGEIPLRETKGNDVLSRPHASVKIIKAVHFLKNGEIWTGGEYEVIEIYNPKENKIHFDGLEKIKC